MDNVFGVKMPRKYSMSSERVLLVFLVIFWILLRHCDSQVNREEGSRPPDGAAGDAGAFFALRSCHQLLHGDAGEFFSPDYLCSNPPLWCNWTIQVGPAQRIHLHLEDLTPDDDCHLKEDQVHVDDPLGRTHGHKVLQRCWREAKYTSSSNTLFVVLLVGGWPSAPYRGFYGRYQAFGPPVVYHPQEGFPETVTRSEAASGLVDHNALVVNGERTESPNEAGLVYDDDGRPSARTAELEPEETAGTEEDQNHRLALGNYSYPSNVAPTAPASTKWISRSGRGSVQATLRWSDSTAPPASPKQQHEGPNQDLKPTTSSPGTIQTTLEEADPEKEGTSADRENSMEVGGTSDQLPAPSEAPEPKEAKQTHPHPNVVEPLSDHRGNPNSRNHSASHLPGDHLFEVTVEVNFSQDLKEPWDAVTRSLLLSVKDLIAEQLNSLRMPLTMSPKRIKRLSTGVLYIIWLQIGPGLQVYRVVHSGLHGFVAVVGENREKVVISMYIEDVDECGTQLVLCDVNADCVNQIASYSCRCRPGFQDKSRLGSGGTICVDLKAAGCSSGLSAETKGVYVLFFLLSSLILMLMAAAGLLYHRHHRGAFLVRCGGISPTEPKNQHHHHHCAESYSGPPDTDLPAPPPPARGFREAWPQVKELCPPVDLQLLRFSPLLPPPDAYREPQDGGKM